MASKLRRWTPDIDPATIPDEVLRSERGRRNAARRQNPSGPRSRGERCPCQVMTLKRAQARGKSYEHDPECSFYPNEPRAIIV